MESQYTFTRYVVLKTCVSILIVLCTSVVTVVGQPVIVNCGENAKLTCTQIGFNASVGHKWVKNGNTVSTTGVDVSGTGRYSEESTSNNFSLIISNAVPEDADFYTCQYSFQPPENKSLVYECKPVESGVTITRNSRGRLHIQVTAIYPNTENVSVTCTPQGESAKSFQGTSGTATANGDHFNITWTSNDTISDGMYTCTIIIVTVSSTEITKKGVVFKSPDTESKSLSVGDIVGIVVGMIVGITIVAVVIYFKIPIWVFFVRLCCRKKGIPSKIVDFTLTYNDDTTFDLDWKYPDDNHRSMVKRYLILLKEFNAAEWERKEEVDALVNKFHLQGLLTEIEYEVGICAESNIGLGEMVCQTIRIDVPSKIADFTLTYNDDTTFGLAWKYPDDNHRSMAKRYLIWLKEFDAAEWEKKGEVDARLTQFHLQGRRLRTKIEYKVGICAENNIGLGEIVFQTIRKGIPDKPVSLGLINIRSERKLIWEPPEYNGWSKIWKYHLETSEDGSNWKLYRQFTARIDKTVESELNPPSTCYIRICAENRNGKGDYLDNVRQQPNDGKPGTPTELNYNYEYPQDVLNVTWKPPTVSGLSTVVKYHILITAITNEEYRRLGKSSTIQYPKLEFNSKEMEVIATTSNTSYKMSWFTTSKSHMISVCAENKHGCSDFSIITL